VGILKDQGHHPILKKPPPEKVPKREAPQTKETPRTLAKAQAQSRHHWRVVPPGNVSRIETPIAERLTLREARQPDAPAPAEAATPPPPKTMVPAPEPVKQSFEEKSARKEWKFMKLKWFAGNEEELLTANGNGNVGSEPPHKSPQPSPRVERQVTPTAAPMAENAAGFQGDLLAMDDIYRAAGISGPRRGYSISKVVEMLRSEHMRGLSKEMRRAAVLMALDAAGVSVDDVLQDAKVRQEAIEAYAADQRKHAEAEWARKAEENLQIQAELEQVKALYAEKIRRNLDGVAREKATFGNWLKLKEQEMLGMAEAVEQVLKPPVSPEAPVDPLLSVTPASVSGKPV
jgi:hypothetical protein